MHRDYSIKIIEAIAGKGRTEQSISEARSAPGIATFRRRANFAEERRKRYVTAISETTTRATRLTSQLLSFSRRQALAPKVFDAARTLESVYDMLGTLTGSRVGIDVMVLGEDLFVDADPNQFETAVVNLSVNARDAMNAEGRITISVKQASRIPPVRSQPALEGDFAVSIADTGTGIAPSDLDRVFEPFFTTKGVGHRTGLDLSQVIGFAKQSGGDVTVESEIRVGTTFALYLPRASGALAKVESDAFEPIDGHGLRVLVVEDNEDVGSFATRTLAELGYEQHWAMDAAAALTTPDADTQGFDAVFADVMMPGA